MHEKDHLDQMLESSLSSYGDPGADTGLAERILTRVSSEKKSKDSASGWRNRLLLWIALPAAACLLLTLVVLKSSGPLVTHPSGGLPKSASSTNTGSKAPGSENVTSAHKTTTGAIRQKPIRSTVAVTRSADRPKLDVFPRPQPLSPEERALYAFATQVPEEQRQAVLAAQQKDDAPLNVAAIHIQPLEILDTSKD